MMRQSTHRMVNPVQEAADRPLALASRVDLAERDRSADLDTHSSKIAMPNINPKQKNSECV
jgi:hypothetical protein